MSNLYWLSETQMAKLEPFFPKSHGKPRVDDRRVLSGIIFINRNGLRWCDAPAAYGPHKKWCDCGGRSPVDRHSPFLLGRVKAIMSAPLSAPENPSHKRPNISA